MSYTLVIMLLWSFVLHQRVRAVDATDTLMDGDSSQSGYLPNHSMDPNIITGGSFGQIWQFKPSIAAGAASDQYYAKPLVYTPSNYGRQVVLVFSEANRIYVLDAQNGTMISSRDLSKEGEGPFSVSDLPSCNDIGQNVGITGTPVINPSTNTVYFWAKSYMISGQSGVYNGAYRFHAVDTITLAERPGFPTNIQNTPADNDNTRWFNGGTHLQRASLNLVNGVVFAGFGGHCDLFNYTGWVVGMSSTSGQLLTAYAMSGGPNAPAQDGTWTGGGGGCGVWMAGGAIASDNAGRLFVSTGNAEGGGEVNQQSPASGRTHLDTLSEAIVNLVVDSQTGVLSQEDYFEPSTYLAMDAGDRDLGAGGVCLPDSTVFSGGGISRLAVACGKNGLCFVTNADNLGGFKMGSAGGDAIVQMITPPAGGSIFGTPGTYPLEGGYLYITPVGAPTYAYALGFDTSNRPKFTLVGQTNESSAGAVGVGPATITTLKGQAGTGILWISDTNGIRAYGAVPVNGILPRITLPAMPGVPKFTRPAFGDGRYYVATSSGSIFAFGAPVALPLTCSSPLDFGSVGIGGSSTLIMNCTANIAITKIVGLSIASSLFQAQNSSLPTGSLKSGATFSFPVTFNMTVFVLSSGSSSATSVKPGVQATALTLYTQNGMTGYSTQQSASLTGTAVSQSPWLSINPLHVNFPEVVIGSAAGAGGSSTTFVIQNIGKANLTISGYAFNNDQNGPNTNVTFSAVTKLDVNGCFSTQDLPAIGTVIPSGGSITVSASFNTTTVGNLYSLLNVYSNGGSAYVILSGTANTLPMALLEQYTNEGGWITIPDCAIPADGCTIQVDIGSLPSTGSLLQTIRLTNTGGSDLTITKSKPPTGSILGATNPSTDFSEGLEIHPGNKTTAIVFFQPGSAQLNSALVVYSGAWTLNTNDLAFGVHVINFTATLAPLQVGPLLGDGTARFKWLGCFVDGAGARIESNEIDNGANNTNGLCQQQALAGNLPFAGTEFQTQCWTGYAVPASSTKVAESSCQTQYTCPGDTTQYCGGYGGYISLYYDSLKYFPANNTFAPGSAPPGPPPSIGSWKYAGCYNDSSAARALSSTNVGVAKTNSLENCAALCQGYNYFGAEYGSECYCGNTLTKSAALFPDSQCSMICPGNSSETCGAGSRMNLYVNGVAAVAVSSSPVLFSTPSINSAAASSTTTSITSSTSIPQTVGSYNYVDCQSDNTTIRTLQGKFAGSPDMTIEYCMGNCTGYQYFGVEYGVECYCGNSLTFGSYMTTDGRCSMVCGGNATEICGGMAGLTLYVLSNRPSMSGGGSAAPSTSTLLSTGASQMFSSSTTVMTASVVSTPLSVISSTGSSSLPSSPTSAASSWAYVGCYNDTSATRALTALFSYTANMTIEQCQSTCLAANYPLAGLEHSNQCFCALSLTYNSQLQPDSSCSWPCKGDRTEICGGSRRLSVYNYTSYVYPEIVPSVGVYSVQGCYIDAVAARVLNGYMFADGTGMTVQECVGACQARGYSLAGVEYASQCFCDNALGFASVIAPLSDCTASFCPGNMTQFCGAPSRLLVYST